MENLQLSCPSLVNGGDLIDDYRVAENGIPDLSIISEEEENSHIPTDMCTSVSSFVDNICSSAAAGLLIKYFRRTRCNLILTKKIVYPSTSLSQNPR